MSIYTSSGRKLVRASLAGTTALTVAVGPNFGAPPAGSGGGGSGGVGPLSVQDFSRDMVVYDDGSAVGRGYATVPVFFGGPAGEVVEARAVSQDDNGATTTAWTPVGTISGAGTGAGALTVPYSDSWFKLEVRLQSTPATTAMTANRFAVGSVFANWGQSESARGWDTSFNNVAIPALVTVKQQIANLKQPGMSGRTSRRPLRVFGVDPLPAGASASGNIVTLTGTGVLEDWYFADTRVDVAAGANWTIRQCLFEEVTQGTTPSFQLYIRLNGRATIHENTFQGMQFATNLAAAVKTEENGSAYGWADIRRNRFLGLPADAIKIVAGPVRWNYFWWRKNLDQIPTDYNASTVYNTGDHVWSAAGHAFSSKVDNNVGNTPPASKTSDSFWLNIDPHVDCVTVEKAFERVDVEFNYFDMAELAKVNGGTGANNYIRFQPNNATPGFTGKVYARFNLCDRSPSASAFPFQITPDFLANVELYGNWLRPSSGGSTNYPFTSAQAARVTWAGNRHIDTDTVFATPANATSIPFTDRTTDNEVQHVFNDRLPSHGSGTVQHRFMTAANRFTPAFAALANMCLMEVPGRKVVWLHHTVSGTGFAELFNDGNPARSWADEAAIHAYATADGGSVGLAYSSWYASPAALALNYGIAVYELFSRKNWTTGADLTAPFSYPSVSSTWLANHFWGDLYAASETRWTLMGPHSRMAAENMTNSIRKADGSTNFTMKNYARCRQGVRNAIADPRTAAYFTPQGLEPANWETGHLSNPSIIDWLHPSSDTLDGLATYLMLLGHGALQAAGLRRWVVPEFDQVFWAPDGSYVDVWSSAGAVTTTRKVRGLPSIGTTHPHWTDCFGWEWCIGTPDWFDGNGLIPVQSAIIVAADGSGTPASAGRVRILKPGGGTWVSGDTVVFGGGAGSGQIVHPDDGNARSWMNLPIVMVGAYGPDGNQIGMSVRPMTAHTKP